MRFDLLRASAKKRAAGGGPTYATWNPADKNTNVTLSNGDLTAYKSDSYGGVRSTVAVSTGKWYWEVLIDSGAGNYPMVGVCPLSLGINTDGMKSSQSFMYCMTNGYKVNSSWPGSAYGATCVNGDRIGVALDMTAGTITFYKNGVSQGVAFSGVTGTLCAVVSSGSGPIQETANFGASAFNYSVPSGFNAGLFT